jgi:hypothetical protein
VWRESLPQWLGLALFPALSGIVLLALGAYAISTFDLITNAVGIGGLIAGVVFFRPQGRATAAALTH